MPPLCERHAIYVLNAAKNKEKRENCMDGFISNIQPFSLQDGPGIRTTVFMKGCNLRCYWCHNPEAMLSQRVVQFFPKKCIGCGNCVMACPYADLEKKCTARFTDRCVQCGSCAEVCNSEALVLTGKKITTDALMQELEKDQVIFTRSGGGVTFSGGEPLLQKEFVLEVLMRCYAAKISTAIETALNVPWETVETVLPYIDVFICDLKAVDPVKHWEGTGVDNARILDNLRNVAAKHDNVLIRTPVIPLFNDTETDMEANANFLASLGGSIRTELLPFHGVCENKYRSMNMEYRARGRKTPEKEHMRRLAAVYKAHGLNVKYE